VKNRRGRAYIKIINTRYTDERIFAPEVELGELDKIAASRLKKLSFRDQNVQTYADNIRATDDTQNTRSHFLQELLRLDHLNKKETVLRIINNK